MNQDQKEIVLSIITENLGIEEEVTPESEFIADLNASHEEVKNIIKLSGEALKTEIDISEPLSNLTIASLFEYIEESFI